MPPSPAPIRRCASENVQRKFDSFRLRAKVEEQAMISMQEMAAIPKSN